MELDFQFIYAYFQPILDFTRQRPRTVIFVSILAFTLFLLVLLKYVGGDLFRLYRRNFLVQVDQGLRDVVMMLEPGQVLTMTLALAGVLGPLIFILTNMAVAIIAVAIILFTPPVILRYMKVKRSNTFVYQMPDTLLALASSLRSGLNLVQSIQQVVRNQPNPIALEFAQILVEYRVGNDLNDSLDGLANRIGKKEVVLMNSAIKISRAVGGNLADTLDTLAKTLREKSRVEGRVRALTSMGKAQGRLATFFPLVMAFVFYKFEPESMSLLFTSSLGHIWLCAMFTLAFLGSLVIKKVVSIDV